MYSIEKRVMPACKVMYAEGRFTMATISQAGLVFDKICQYINACGGEVLSSFMLYLGDDQTHMDVDICVVVPSLYPEAEGIKAKELGEVTGLFAVATHAGGLDSLLKTYESLFGWINGQGLTFLPEPMWEVYKPDAVEILVPVAK